MRYSKREKIEQNTEKEIRRGCQGKWDLNPDFLSSRLPAV
jgi:hypothetical protein